MSRTMKGSKGPGQDWWGRRPFAGHSAWSRHAGITKFWKTRTHRVERQWAKQAERKARYQMRE